eukprot:superscaffoldBa00004251_g18539
MFLRWKRADLVTDLMCDWKERVESRMRPRWRTSGDGEMEQPSTSRRKSPTFWSSASGVTGISVYLSKQRAGSVIDQEEIVLAALTSSEPSAPSTVCYGSMCGGGAGGDVNAGLFLQVDLADMSLNACSQPASGLFSLKAKLIQDSLPGGTLLKLMTLLWMIPLLHLLLVVWMSVLSWLSRFLAGGTTTRAGRRDGRQGLTCFHRAGRAGRTWSPPWLTVSGSDSAVVKT